MSYMHCTKCGGSLEVQSRSRGSKIDRGEYVNFGARCTDCNAIRGSISIENNTIVLRGNIAHEALDGEEVCVVHEDTVLELEDDLVPSDHVTIGCYDGDEKRGFVHITFDDIRMKAVGDCTLAV